MLQGAVVVLGLGLLLAAAVFRELNGIRGQLVVARQTLQQVSDDPSALRTEPGRRATLAEVDGAVQSVASARRRTTTSKVLAPLRLVPGLRSQMAGLETLIDDSRQAATAGRNLLAKVDALARESRVSGGRVPLAELAGLSVELETTAGLVGRLERSSGGLLGPLGDARREFDEAVRSGSRRLDRAADALDAARSFMGAEGDRRYLVALQNNAEMRDQGMVLSYAIARFEGGRLIFDRNGPIHDLRLAGPTATPVPPETASVFGFLNPTRFWQSVNATADFTWSARAMADMYRQATGESIDGIIAIDVPGVMGVLRAIGGVQVPGIAQPITAGNAARILLHDLYEGLPPLSDVSDRREQLGEVTKAVIQRLTVSDQDPVALGKELGDAAKGGHVRLWSADPEEEEVFERTGLGGGPGTIDADRTFHMAVENRTATKLDYYVKPSVRQDVQLTPQGSAIVRTTMLVDNTAPVGAAPSYQLGPDNFTERPGDYLAWVLLWGPTGSTQPGGIPESGLVLSQQVAAVAAGQRREVRFDTVIPNAVREGRLELRLVPQARLAPVDLEIRLEAPGWDVDGAESWKGRWDQVRVFSWRVSR